VPLSDALSDGSLGVRARLPAGVERIADDHERVRFVDRARGVEVWLMFDLNVALDLGEARRAQLPRDIERHARYVFDRAYEGQPRDHAPPQPRTADTTWSPVIEIDVVPAAGATALWMLHRVFYQPGLEAILGHLAVPLAQGLFEVRLVAVSHQTGLRETLVFAQMGRDGSRVMQPQSVYDAPERDAAFPSHPLSRLRVARRELVPELALEVTRAPTADANGGAEIFDGLGWAVDVPPGFCGPRALGEGTTGGVWTRASFCITDGVDMFWLESDGPARAEGERELTRRARERHVAAGLRDLAVAFVPSDDARVLGVTIAEGIGHIGPLRNATAWVADAGELCLITRGGPAVHPRDEMVADLVATASTLRRLRRFVGSDR